MSGPPQRVTFVGSQRAELAARLDLPAAPPLAYALFAHCFTCSKDIFAAGHMAAELNRRGIGVLRFDFTGLGASGGDFANTDFSSNIEDLWLAAGWMSDNLHAPQLLVGHSLGGAAALAVANDIPSVRAVATLGAPASLDHVTRLFTDRVDEIRADGTAEVTIAGRPFKIRRSFLDDLATHAISDRARDLNAALLVLHSPDDATVSIDNAEALFAAAKHPKAFVSIDGADHLLTRSADAVFAASVTATWASRFLLHDHPAAAVPTPRARVVVAETRQGTFLNDVVVGEHHFLADEPVSVGGFDAGPSPYDLLAAALGACTSMTLRLYAERKKLPLDRVTVEVSHDKVHATDCETCAEESGVALIDRFERRLVLDGDLDDADLQSLLRIADRCPVHRTLEASSHIHTQLGHR